jgi:acetyl-CoA C-acetyltransferase
MTEAVIVSTARTPIGKAYRGALNNTEGPTMAGHVAQSSTLVIAVRCSDQ